MTKENKELLLKDLCSRLPYNPIIKVGDYYHNVYGYIPSDTKPIATYFFKGSENPIYTYQPLKYYKPYLRPMSSMTNEEKHECQDILGDGVEISDDFIYIIDSSIKRFTYLELEALFSWLNKKMFDYYNLIPKGLAFEVPEKF